MDERAIASDDISGAGPRGVQAPDLKHRLRNRELRAGLSQRSSSDGCPSPSIGNASRKENHRPTKDLSPQGD